MTDKKEQKESHHILIYGFCLDDHPSTEPKKDFILHKMPMYGNFYNKNEKGYNQRTFIGFEYGMIKGLYDHATTKFDDMQLSQDIVPDVIKQSFSECYPDIEPKCYALIQNVYTSHYASGLIMYGYFMDLEATENVDEDYDIRELVDRMQGNKDFDFDIEYFSAGHNMKYPNDYMCFVGKKVTELPCLEDSDESAILAEQLTKVHSRPTNIKTSEEIKNIIEKFGELKVIKSTKIPQMATIQTMCYCCT